MQSSLDPKGRYHAFLEKAAVPPNFVEALVKSNLTLHAILTQ